MLSCNAFILSLLGKKDEKIKAYDIYKDLSPNDWLESMEYSGLPPAAKHHLPTCLLILQRRYWHAARQCSFSRHKVRR